MKATKLVFALAVLASGACDFNTTDPNNPGPIGTNPSRSEVQNAAIGIILASRADASGWVLTAGIIGREAYRFDGSEPRYISELLQGPFDPGGFGGAHWTPQYNAIRSTNELLNVVGTAAQLTGEEQDGTRGFAETMQALNFLGVLMAHSQDSIPIDVNRPINAALAPFVSNDSAYRFVSALLDSADAHLAVGGGSFPFSLPSGFSGFDTPASFRQFNRALQAAVQVYRGSLGCGATCYTAAKSLLESGATFVDTSDAGTLQDGVYYNYSTNPGDGPNPLFLDPAVGENLAHPSAVDSAESKPGGGLDDRVTSKVTTIPARTAGTPSLTTTSGWIRYLAANAPIPIIKNEELVLLRAEANNALGNAVAAANDVNYIRRASGGLDSIAGLSAQSQSQILGAILRERKYSLLYEGHRWFDMRRTGRLNQVIIDRPSVDIVHPTYPINGDEVNARK